LWTKSIPANFLSGCALLARPNHLKHFEQFIGHGPLARCRGMRRALVVIERREVMKTKTNVKAGEFTIRKTTDSSSPVLF
jgi:hypothetical protein